MIEGNLLRYYPHPACGISLSSLAEMKGRASKQYVMFNYSTPHLSAVQSLYFVGWLGCPLVWAGRMPTSLVMLYLTIENCYESFYLV